MGCLRGGRGMWWRPNPPDTPTKLTLPQYFPKGLVPTSAAVRGLHPRGLHKGSILFAGASHAHMTLEWVFCHLVRCQIHRQGENKATLRGDSETASEGGAWTWRLLPGELLSPIPEGIGIRSLISLNLCGDP